MILLIHQLHVSLPLLIPASPVEAGAQLHCREMVVKMMIFNVYSLLLLQKCIWLIGDYYFFNSGIIFGLSFCLVLL